MRTLAVIQARIGSSRFPGKVISDIKGKPLIVHVIGRLKRCRLIDHIVLASSSLPQDRVLLEIAQSEGVQGFGGSENDVLDRYYQAAKQHHPEMVVRCTGDCPVIDPGVTDFVIRRHIENGKDYTSNTLIRTYPRGLDTEVMTFQTLERAAREAVKPYEREHVIPYIFEHPNLFSTEQVVATADHHRPDLRLTVDTHEDYDLIREIYRHLYDSNPHFSIDDILNLFKKHPDLKKINAHVKQKCMV
jgi:spore coat polysaccharide biosynthesis protein SpsF